MKTILITIILTLSIYAQGSNPIRNIFMQGNNINTVFRTNGIFNYDWVTFPTSDAGFIWPVSSITRKTAVYASGVWIGAKVGPQRELRLAASWFASHFTPGYIPIIGQPTPQSVCNDTTWRGYFVQLTDQSLVNGGVRTKTAGGRTYTFTYDAWANWPVAKGAPYVEINGLPGYQPGWNSDRPGIGNGSIARPDELLFMVFMDYSNCTNSIHLSQVGLPGGTLPLGIEIHQLSFMFNCQSLKDMYFMKYKFINKSSLLWDSAYISFVNDIDIGVGHCGASDDALGCDTSRNLAFYYNADDSDCNYGINPPSLGTRFLQSPLRYTGNNNDTAKLPYDTLIGYKHLGMNTHIMFHYQNWNPCNNDPDNAISGYNFMKGNNACDSPYIHPVTGLKTLFIYSGNACNRTGWFDSSSWDKRNIVSSGPFKMNSGDTQIAVFSYLVTRDGGNNFQNVCALQSLSDTALKYYYNDFQTCIPIGIQPISNEVPEKFMLYQNYPNPFNPVTSIKFSIPSLLRRGAGVVLLKVYDILGQDIATLVNDELNPGIYEVDWNAENYPSGVYFYSITTNNYFESKKMVLIK